MERSAHPCAAFAEEWKAATYEKGETQSFYNAFFQVFGVKRRSVARYEAHVAKLNNRSGFIDLFRQRVLLAQQKSYEQAGEEARATEQPLGKDVGQADPIVGEITCSKKASPTVPRPRCLHCR